MKRTLKKRPVRRPAPTEAPPQDGIFVAVPTRGRIMVETMHAVTANLRGYQTCIGTVARRPITEARNELARGIREYAAQSPRPFRDLFVLWTDDDAWWPQGYADEAIRILRSDETIGVVVGCFTMRQPFCEPLAFKGPGQPIQIGVDCALGAVIDVQTAGGVWFMHRPDLLAKLPDEPFTIRSGNPLEGGEDTAFMCRVREAGLRVVVATGLQVPHIGDDGLAFLPYAPPLRIEGDRIVRMPLSSIKDHAEHALAAERRQYGAGLPTEEV